MFQVWQNDGLPTQICNKCVAKLHISYQFKRQCEKSDAKLRQYLTGGTTLVNDHSTENHHHQQQQHAQQQQTQPQQAQQQHNSGQVAPVQPQQADSCVYIECNPLIEMGHDHRYDAAIPPVTVAPDITQIGYNQMPIGGYSLQTIGQVQVYIKLLYDKFPCTLQILQIRPSVPCIFPQNFSHQGLRKNQITKAYLKNWMTVVSSLYLYSNLDHVRHCAWKNKV